MTPGLRTNSTWWYGCEILWLHLLSAVPSPGKHVYKFIKIVTSRVGCGMIHLEYIHHSDVTRASWLLQWTALDCFFNRLLTTRKQWLKLRPYHRNPLTTVGFHTRRICDLKKAFHVTMSSYVLITWTVCECKNRSKNVWDDVQNIENYFLLSCIELIAETLHFYWANKAAHA